MTAPTLAELVDVIVPDLTPSDLARIYRLSPMDAFAFGAARAAGPLIRARQADQAALSAVLDNLERTQQ